jgi:hypothetical protein
VGKVVTRGPRSSASVGCLLGRLAVMGQSTGAGLHSSAPGAHGQAGLWAHEPVRSLGPVEAEMAFFHFLVYPKSFLFLFLIKSRPLICKYTCATCVLVLRGRH